MKTAISIPDSIFHTAEGMAHRLGISRSELYSKAVADYTKKQMNRNITEKLNEIYDEIDSSLDKRDRALQYNSLDREDW